MEKRKKVDSIIKLVSSLGWKIIRVPDMPMSSNYQDCFLIGVEETVDKVLTLINRPTYINKKTKEKPSIGWIQEYRDLFPAKIRSGGFPVRGDFKGCIKKMEKFLEDYPEYNKELILKVTKNYVERKKLENYAYMQLSHYFINKDGISSLAAECENCIEVPETENILDI